MKRSLFILFIILFHLIDSFAQNNSKIKRLTISYWGDSIIPQNYELIIKSKKIFFINPVINYLDIKGGKHKYHVHIKRRNRQEIFNYLDKIDFSSLKDNEKLVKLDHSNLVELINFKGSGNYYSFEIMYQNRDIESYTIPDEFLPSDLKELYNKIITAK